MYGRQLGGALVRDHRDGGVPAIAVAAGQAQHAGSVCRYPDLGGSIRWRPEVHHRCVQLEMLPIEIERTTRLEAHVDDLERLFEASDRCIDVDA